jgi:luciferase family oxidoreductase group 1
MAEMLAYVDGFPDDHPFQPLRAIPDDVPLPPLWILGSSLYGGRAAAAFGTGFAFAGHFGSADPAEAVGGYREHFEPSQRMSEPRVMLGVAAIVAESEERAEALARAHDLASVRLMQNQPGPVPTPEEAEAHAWTEQELAAARSRRHFVSVGTPEQVHADLERRRREADADELIVTTQVHDPAERRLSYELLAKAYGL